MTKILNVLDCTKTMANTGAQTCPLDIKEVSAIIQIPKDSAITPAQQLALQTTILAGINNNNPILRWYPLTGIVGLEDKSTDSTTETYGYGGMGYLADGEVSFVVEHKDGLTMHKLYRQAFHNKQDQYDILIVDKKNKIIVGWEDSEANLRGFSLGMLAVDSWKVATGTSATSKYKVQYGLSDSTQWNDTIVAIKIPNTLDVSSIKGLTQTYLNNATTTFTTGVATIQVFGATTNLYGVYGATLTDPSIWKVYDKNNQPILIDTIALDTAFEGVEITLDVTDANYIASASGDTFKVVLGGVSDLIQNDMPYLSDATLLTTRS